MTILLVFPSLFYFSVSLAFERYLMTTAALGLIGVSQEETVALFRALAGIISLGQVGLGSRLSGPAVDSRLKQRVWLPLLCVSCLFVCLFYSGI